MTPADALTAAFRFVDDEAGRINGVLNEPSGPAMDDVAMDLCKAFGLPLDQHWPEALAARLSADAARVGELEAVLKPFADMADELERVAEQHAIHPSKVGRSHRYEYCSAARAALERTTRDD